ncbi:MAG: acyl-CoA dehydrogenase family protein [Betaproteobacteria bacterium]
MTFTVKPIFDSEFRDAALRFAKDADADSVGTNDIAQSVAQRRAKWSEALDLGWAACLVPERLGGLGGTALDFCGLLEGVSHYALPLPVCSGMGLPALLLSEVEFAGKDALLADMAAGVVRIQPVWRSLDRYCKDLDTQANLRMEGTAAGWSVTGQVSGVEEVPDATHYLLACEGWKGDVSNPLLCLFPVGSDRLRVMREMRIDGRHTLSLRFDRLALTGEQVLVQGKHVGDSFDRTYALGTLFVCVEAVASMGSVLEQTIRYLSERKQFGVTLSSFQVLRHYVADAYVRYECFRAFVTAQAEATQSGAIPDDRDISLLKLYLSQVGPMIAHMVIQTHGGMGMTEELWATRLNKRILMANLEYGDGQFHRERLSNSSLDAKQHA